MSTPDRRVLVLAHTGRESAVVAAEELVQLLVAAGIKPIVMPSDAEGLTERTMERLHPAGSQAPLAAV